MFMEEKYLEKFATYTPTRFYPRPSELINAAKARSLWQDHLAKEAVDNTKVNLQLVFPFCAKRCFFCFCQTKKPDENLLNKYVDYLASNLDYFSSAAEGFKFHDLMIGSGSVNLLSEEQLNLLLGNVFSGYHFADRNKTVEIFPDPDFNQAKLEILTKYGIDKVSIGVETFNKEIIEAANRQYKSPVEIKNTIELLRQNKIININLDFILGLAGHDFKGVLHDLREAVKLEPAQIALYTLQPTRTYTNLHFKNKDSFYQHLDKFTRKIAMIDSLMSKFDYVNYASNEAVNVYYNNKYKADLEKMYFDYPFWGGCQDEYSNFSLGQFSPNYLRGEYFVMNRYNGNDYIFNDQEEVFDLIKFNKDDLAVDFALGYWGRNMALPLNDFQACFAVDFLEKFPQAKQLIEDEVLRNKGKSLKFNPTLNTKQRLLYMIKLFPRLFES